MSSPAHETDNESRWYRLREKVAGEQIKAAFGLFRADGIEPVLIKGWAAARYYPEKARRIFSDIDLCVSPGEFEKARALLRTPGGSRLNVDLHCGLRHLDRRPWSELFGDTVLVPLEGVPVRVLADEDHLRVLCVHWLTDGGAYKERLLDIYHLLENRADGFDWEKCLAGADAKRRGWILKTLSIVHREYGLDVSGMPFAAELNSVPGWFVKALESEWASGTKLLDIHAVGGSRSELWGQLKKRLSPNPIQATVLMDGSFEKGSRLYYRIGSFWMRLKPSLKKALQRWRARPGGGRGE